MILLTTSHRSTRRIRSLCNDLDYSMPGLIKVNRGKMSFFDLANKAIQMGIDKVMLIDRWKGGPGRIRLFKVFNGNIKEIAPRLYVSGVKLRREFEISGREAGKTIKNVFLDKMEMGNIDVEKLVLSLSEFFELPIFHALEAPLNYDAYLRVSAGENGLAYISFHVLPSNTEIGPRIKISHAVWQL